MTLYCSNDALLAAATKIFCSELAHTGESRAVWAYERAEAMARLLPMQLPPTPPAASLLQPITQPTGASGVPALDANWSPDAGVPGVDERGNIRRYETRNVGKRTIIEPRKR